MDQQPTPTALDVLPMFDAVLETCEALVDALVPAALFTSRQCLAEFELAQLAWATEWAQEARHSRTGNGPWPGSSSRWPVAKRDNR